MSASFEMRIELGKAREFARAVDHPDPIEDGDPVPLTFLQTSAFWMPPGAVAWPEGAGDLSRMLHGQQTYAFHGGPIRVGEVLVGQGRMGETWTKQGRRGGTMTFRELITDYRSPAGELRAEVTTLSIETEAPVS